MWWCSIVFDPCVAEMYICRLLKDDGMLTLRWHRDANMTEKASESVRRAGRCSPRLTEARVTAAGSVVGGLKQRSKNLRTLRMNKCLRQRYKPALPV